MWKDAFSDRIFDRCDKCDKFTENLKNGVGSFEGSVSKKMHEKNFGKCLKGEVVKCSK